MSLTLTTVTARGEALLPLLFSGGALLNISEVNRSLSSSKSHGARVRKLLIAGRSLLAGGVFVLVPTGLLGLVLRTGFTATYIVRTVIGILLVIGGTLLWAGSTNLGRSDQKSGNICLTLSAADENRRKL